MLNVIFAFCMFLSGLGFNLNATLEGAGINTPLTAGAAEDGPLSDLLIAVNDLSITDEEYYSDEEFLADSDSELLASHHAPAGCGPRVRRCRSKARCCKPKVRKCKPKCHKVKRCCKRKRVKRCCKPKVRKCKPKCHKVRRCAPKVRKCKPKCHKVRRCAPKVRKCKPKCHKVRRCAPKKVKRCCKPKVRKCNPRVRKCAPVRKPVVRKAPVGCGPRVHQRVHREVKRVPVGCGPLTHQRVQPSAEYPSHTYAPQPQVRREPARNNIVQQRVGSSYTAQPSYQAVPPVYRAPSVELDEQAPSRYSVSSAWDY